MLPRRRRRGRLRRRCGGQTATASVPRSSSSSTGSSRGAAGSRVCTSTTTPSYERTALTRLAGEHGTREQEVDDFLRQEVLVDLYRVVKQALRASTDSYSIKAIEKLYGFERTADVVGRRRVGRPLRGVDRDAATTRCSTTSSATTRKTAARPSSCTSGCSRSAPPELPWRAPPGAQRERNEEAEERDAERAALRARLLEGAEEGEPRRLLAHLLDYHQREQRPEWWAWFRWPQLDDDELVRDRTAIGGLSWDGQPPEVEVQQPRLPDDLSRRRSTRSTRRASAPTTASSFRTPRRRRPRHRHAAPRHEARGRAAPARADSGPADRRLGQARRAAAVRPRVRGRRRRARYPALVALLERRAPDVRLDADPVEAALSLGESYLFVQGPPGSGKTWQGARMAVALMREGKRVGVTSLSHKAIHNLLRAIQHEADAQEFAFRGVKRARDEDDPETEFESRCIVSSSDADVCADPVVRPRRRNRLGARPRSGRPPRGRAADRRALRRRGRPALARRRARRRHERPLARPARRPEPAAAGLAGLASRGLGVLRAPAPARRATRPFRPTAGSSSPRPGACGPSSARSPRTRTTRAGSATRP